MLRFHLLYLITQQVYALGCLNILEAIKSLNMINKVRFYQAGTSEMFGKVLQTPQTEKTPFYPRSPYGVSKVFSHWMTVNYRDLTICLLAMEFCLTMKAQEEEKHLSLEKLQLVLVK